MEGLDELRYVRESCRTISWKSILHSIGGGTGRLLGTGGGAPLCCDGGAGGNGRSCEKSAVQVKSKRKENPIADRDPHTQDSQHE